MRILLTMYRDDPAAGGSLRVGQGLLKGLRRLGVDAQACFAYGGPGPVGNQDPGFCNYLGLRKSNDLARWPRARKLLREFRPDIVHCVDPLLWMHLATVGTRAPFVVHVHGGFVPWKRITWRHRARWWLLSTRARAFVGITHGARRDHTERGLFPESRSDVVYNGIDWDWFQHRPPREEAKKLLGLPQDALIIGMVCRLFNARGCDDFLRILPLLPREWQGVLVGDGPEKPKLEALSNELGIRQRVRFVGNLADVRPAYSAMDAFAFLALYDSFGLAMAEAMSCRVPVFGLYGPGEYCEPENPLITVENAAFLPEYPRQRVKYEQAEDPAALRALADRIQAYGREPASLAAMTERAYQHVRDRFTIDVQAREMLRIYQGILAGSTAGRTTEERKHCASR